MALPQTFKAMVVSETAEKTFSREVRERALGDLPAGELIIEVLRDVSWHLFPALAPPGAGAH